MRRRFLDPGKRPERLEQLGLGPDLPVQLIEEDALHDFLELGTGRQTHRLKLGARQPSSPAKFAFALVFVGLAFVLLMPAGALAQSGVKVSPLWLVGAYFIQELGELCLSPVGLSLVTKLSPVRLVKSGAAYRANARVPGAVRWARGFYAASVHKRDLARIVAYIRGQHRRHPDRIPRRTRNPTDPGRQPGDHPYLSRHLLPS